jgi:DNA mismatch endonuclease (patch repair protein)
MKAVRRRDTPPELAIRSALHRRGLRFRVDRAPVEGIRRRADIVFVTARVAVFVDGCFWHGCPTHGSWPKANGDWWRRKILANQQRDADTNRKLERGGWLVVRVWEHEDPEAAAERIERMVRGQTY